MADAKWSDNIEFPIAPSIDGTESLVGLKSGNNMKAPIASRLLPYLNANTQLASSAQVTGLNAQLAAKANTNGSNATGTWPIGITGNSATVTTNANLTGDVTSVGNATTIATVNTNVGTFGNATNVSQFTVNAKGQITAASNVTISGVPPGGAAGGDLSGTYPNPSVSRINGNQLGSTTPTSGNILLANGSQWVSTPLPPIPLTTDDLPQGVNNWYVTQDGGITDSLATLPTIIAIQNNLENINLSPRELVYIDPVDGNDVINTGSLTLPVKSYDIALTVASSKSPSITNPIGIVPLGIINITGDMEIFPFIDIVGETNQLSQFNVSGNLVTVPTSSDSRYIIENCTLNINGKIISDFGGYPHSTTIIYRNINFSNSPLIYYSRSSLNNIDSIIFIDCIGNLQSTDVLFENVNCSIINCDFMKNVSFTNSNNFYDCQLNIFNSASPQDIKIISTFGSNASILDTKSSNITCTLSFDGTPCQWYTDSTSYGTNPTFSNGASFNNVFLLSLSNGIYQGSYTPLNYTPTAGSDFKAASVTGNFKGIDDALAGFSPITLTSGEVIAGNSFNQQQATVVTSSNGSIIWDSSVDGILDATANVNSATPYYGSFKVTGLASSSGTFSAANTYMPLLCGSAYRSDGDSFLFTPGLYTIDGVFFVPGIQLQNFGQYFEVEFLFNITFQGADISLMRDYRIQASTWNGSTVTQTGFTSRFTVYPFTPVISVPVGLSGFSSMNPLDILFLQIQNLSNTQSVNTTDWNASIKTIRQL